MKKFLPLTAAVALLSFQATAGPEHIIKQRAKEVRDQNNVRQGVPPPTTPPPQPAAARPAAPVATPQQQSLARFSAGLAAIKAGATVTPAQKQQLLRDFIGAAQDPAKVSRSAAEKMIEKITAAQVEKPLSAPSRSRLVTDLDALLNPTKYPQVSVQAVYNDVQAIFQENGLSRAKAVAISDDAKALGTR